jgi:hypothetical protein
MDYVLKDVLMEQLLTIKANAKDVPILIVAFVLYIIMTDVRFAEKVIT